jgi:hypothetical protein
MAKYSKRVRALVLILVVCFATHVQCKWHTFVLGLLLNILPSLFSYVLMSYELMCFYAYICYIDVFNCFNYIGIGMDGMDNEKINVPKGLCFHDFWPSCNPNKDLCYCCFDNGHCYKSMDECKSHCPSSSSGEIETSPSALP